MAIVAVLLGSLTLVGASLAVGGRGSWRVSSWMSEQHSAGDISPVAQLPAPPPTLSVTAPGQSSDASTDRRTSRQIGAASAVPGLSGRRSAEVQALLDARSAAISARDEAAWMASVDQPTSAFGRRQRLVFDNMVQLPIQGLTYTVSGSGSLTPQRRKAAGSEAFLAIAQGRYQLGGFGPATRTFDAAYTFVRRAGGWRIASDADRTTASQPWDLTGLKVQRTAATLVIGNASPQRMTSYAREAEAAVQRVSSVWGTSWPRVVVLLVPATRPEFAALIGEPVSRALDQIAAVTQGPIDPGGPATGDVVVVNPTTFDALQASGRRVVITHEVTHVAIRSSTTGAVPTWLSEGMADYVGYAGLGLAPTVVAAELLRSVRAGNGPRALPAADDYDAAHGPVAPAYSASWLACQRLAQRYGAGRLVALYRDIAATTGAAVDPDPTAATAAAFQAVLGVTQSAFVADWTRYLSALARAP